MFTLLGDGRAGASADRRPRQRAITIREIRRRRGNNPRRIDRDGEREYRRRNTVVNGPGILPRIGGERSPGAPARPESRAETRGNESTGGREQEEKTTSSISLAAAWLVPIYFRSLTDGEIENARARAPASDGDEAGRTDGRME